MGTRSLRTVVALAVAITAPAAVAEVFIYRGPDGERLISDRPMPGYTLVRRQDSMRNAGQLLANRPIETGGPGLFQSYIRAASHRYGVEHALIEAVIEVESDFDPNAVSSAGAQGLMQLMPLTAAEYNVRDRRNPRENINAGVKHLAKLIERFRGNLPHVLAAYNAGAGAVERHQGIPPYPETERYVKKVLSAHAKYRAYR